MSQTETPVEEIPVSEKEIPVKKKEPVGTQDSSTGETMSVNEEQLKRVVAQAVSDQFSVTSAWKDKNVKFIVECPSGQRCLVKHLDTMDLVNADLIEDMDFFSKALIPKNIDLAGNPIDDDQPIDTFWGALRDPQKRLKLFDMLNRLCEIGVVNPKVINDGAEIVSEAGKEIVVLGRSVVTDAKGAEFINTPMGPRQITEDQVRTSNIDFADKMAIFGELNKPLGLIQPFREEENRVADMETVERVTSSA